MGAGPRGLSATFSQRLDVEGRTHHLVRLNSALTRQGSSWWAPTHAGRTLFRPATRDQARTIGTSSDHERESRGRNSTRQPQAGRRTVPPQRSETDERSRSHAALPPRSSEAETGNHRTSPPRRDSIELTQRRSRISQGRHVETAGGGGLILAPEPREATGAEFAPLPFGSW